MRPHEPRNQSRSSDFVWQSKLEQKSAREIKSDASSCFGFKAGATMHIMLTSPPPIQRTLEHWGKTMESTPGGDPDGSHYVGLPTSLSPNVSYVTQQCFRAGDRAGFRPDSDLGSLKICSPAALRPAGGPMSKFSRLEPGRNQAWKPDLQPGCAIS